MRIRPTLRSPLYRTSDQPALPLVLVIPDPKDALRSIPRPLLPVVIVGAMRGVIFNCIAAEYGKVLQFWTGYLNRGTGSRDLSTVMVQAEEAFETVVEILADLSDHLSLYSGQDHLMIELLRYDPFDQGFVVRLSDG